MAIHADATPADSEAEGEFLRGNALCDARRFSEALAYYERAIELGLRDEVVWNNRGVALDSVGRHEEALQSYRHALKANPAYETAWYNMGNAFSYLGQYEKAVECYDKAVELNPQYRIALYDKGIALAHLGKTRRAHLIGTPRANSGPIRTSGPSARWGFGVRRCRASPPFPTFASPRRCVPPRSVPSFR